MMTVLQRLASNILNINNAAGMFIFIALYFYNHFCDVFSVGLELNCKWKLNLTPDYSGLYEIGSGSVSLGI